MSRKRETVDYLSVDDLLTVAAGVLDRVDLRDPGLLASACARPRTTVFGDEAYPTVAEKAAALLHALARNHPLVDGNKRLAWAAMRVFCLLNERDVSFTVDQAEQLVLAAATGAHDVAELARAIGEHLT